MDAAWLAGIASGWFENLDELHPHALDVGQFDFGMLIDWSTVDKRSSSVISQIWWPDQN